MVRPRKPRCVQMLPEATYFKPRGVPLRFLQEVTLSIEELEAVRLKDLEKLDGEQAAALMRVSRPTFQRILDAARHRIAEALIGGKALRIEGGDYQLAMTTLRCSHCRHEWQSHFGHGRHGADLSCPVCQKPGVAPTE